MSRIRLSVIVGGLVVALATSPLTTEAQQQGGGGRGNRGGGGAGGRGGPGGGGFGGFGFGGFGGPGGSIVSLAGLEPVQKEVKITEAQKTKIAKLSTDSESKRRQFFENLRQQGDAARAQLQAEQGNLVNNLQQGEQPLDPRNQSLVGLGGADRGFGANPYNAGQQQEGVDPNALQQGFREQQNGLQAQNRAMMQQGMAELQAASEQGLGKILDRNQIRRLHEIQLQLDGPFAVLKPDVADKLEVNEDQAAAISEIKTAADSQRRQIMSQMRDVFQSLRNNQPGQPAANGANTPPANTGANGNANGGRGRQGGRANNGAQAANGGPGGPGGPGGQAGPGGNRRGGFDPEAMRKLMEQPEVKTKMDEVRKQEEALTDRSYALVYKALDRRQVSNFKKMLGKPFDVSLIRGGPGGRGRPAAPATASDTPAAAPANGNAAAPATPGAANDDEDDAPAKSPAPKSATADATPPKRATTKSAATEGAATNGATTKPVVRRRGSR